MSITISSCPATAIQIGQKVNIVRIVYYILINHETPDRDEFILLEGSSVELSVKYPGPGPVGAKTQVNGETVLTRSVHPKKTKYEFGFSRDIPGRYSIQIIIEGAKSGELEKLRKGEIKQPEEEERMNAEWDIIVADEDKLYNDDIDKIKNIVESILLLYSLGSIGFKAVQRVWKYAEGIPEEDREEITALYDIDESEINIEEHEPNNE
ncbi:hypothetical protein [Natrinema sp. SYSU A 869]|uniref:hypothetical protein n=1 Tax=Natrinema sp. SYSU A 869 TaxID=2871694 RepID=UPI001CA45161|nr:hypothetical protein [Natrinema sp. SYSU A 869]